MSKLRLLKDEAAALIVEMDTLRSFTSDDQAEVASAQERLSASASRCDEIHVEMARETELDNKLKALRTAVANDSDSRSAIETPKQKEPIVNVRNFDSHASAVTAGSYLRSIARGEVRNHMKETDAGNGKELVPVELYGNIVNQMTRQSVALRVAAIFNTISNKIVLPKVSNSTAAFYNEATCGNLTGIDTEGVELTLYGLRSLTAVSNDLIEDSVVDVASMFASNVSNAFAAKIDYAWLQGDATASIVGLATKVLLGSQIVENAAVTTPAKLAAVVGKIDPLATNTSWVVSPEGYAALLEAHGGTQSVMLADAMQPSVYGRPVYVTTGLPTGVLALYGDFSMATAVGLKASGLRIDALREVQAIDDRVVFAAKQRVGIANHAENFVAALVVNGF